MLLSPHSLHAPILKTAQQQAEAEAAVTAAAGARPRLFDLTLGPKDVYQIGLKLVSTAVEFDATIDVGLRGGPSTTMIVDTGNSCLILPRYEDIQALADPSPYTVLVAGQEPWGCQANLVRGPIDLVDVDGSVFTIANCIFWACTANDVHGQRTANFGTGCLTQWDLAGGNSLTPAQVYNAGFPYAEFDFEPAAEVLSPDATVKVSTGSVLRISRTEPAGYSWFDIQPGDWMMLLAKRLSLGASATGWPGAAQVAVAMIDTGGQCAFLVDPDALVFAQPWPPMAAANPTWVEDPWRCETTQRAFTLELGDARNSFTYTLDSARLPPALGGDTLVMCQSNNFMQGLYGLNIGGMSALVVAIAVDYGQKRVGLKAKGP